MTAFESFMGFTTNKVVYEARLMDAVFVFQDYFEAFASSGCRGPRSDGQ